jgi:beta-fructofuranosidase
MDPFAHDPHRPGYHFLPPTNWLNDPNGLIQWQGVYHMFYQYNPDRPVHGNIHWGHAVSEDLVHWTHLPIALAPSPDSPDEDGCWSGCAVDDQGVPTLIYTGLRHGEQRPCLATGSADLRTWQKWPGNPIIADPPPGLELTGFRDHSLWQEGATWYQIIGSGLAGVGGTALLYRSQDLRQWEYLHPLCVGDRAQTQPVWLGTMWECPDFFALEAKHVLLVSVWDEGHLHYTAYQAGEYATQHFTPQTADRLDFGNNYFSAPQTMQDDQGRRLIWAWIQEGRSIPAQIAAGWSGVMSLPRVLSLQAGGRVGTEPVPELQALRRAHHRFTDLAIAPDQDYVLDGVLGDMLESIAELEWGTAQCVGLKLRRAPQGEEETLIVYDVRDASLTMERTKASLDPDTEHSPRAGHLQIAPGERLRLHIFLDRSVLEVFANGGTSLTSRVYPTRADSLGLALVASGGTARLTSLDVWEMASIWATTMPGSSPTGLGPVGQVSSRPRSR